MNKRVIDFSLGLFFIISLIALIFLAFWATSGKRYTKSEYQLYANFDDVSGLKVRSPVRVAGVRVGEVDNIVLLQENFKAKVIISIYDKRLTLPKDSVASIMTEGLLGSKYIHLEPGFEENSLSPGDRLIHTHSAVVLENILGLFLSGISSGGEKDEVNS
jgi:phospholipid/cholesterol/gamma-HCH transport system substrate-binding protein